MTTFRNGDGAGFEILIVHAALRIASTSALANTGDVFEKLALLSYS